ncbi:hypothetical protein EDD68_11744 [Melghiribacillus thermohalophilus]|uniref:TM2 domain-containing protein n=1 Tax=Melghiribacillus thermohalophilus TaxID=1324956 RepID=A0A4R3MT95_9BACI|nr:hypothetical protein [Melghiribacillus thermohalophilus]TCT19650.1 hypothetical protein EDD68_11744 [Melghiribacillus thermohalophilus]
MNKSSAVAFLLAFFPGLGHIYLDRKIRGVMYAFSFVGALGLTFITGIMIFDDMLSLFFLLTAAGIWGINMLDIVMTLLWNRDQNVPTVAGSKATTETANVRQVQDSQTNERFLTIILSFIPGVGHFHLGLNQRGVTLLAGFLGLGSMVLFVSILTREVGFLLFLFILPVIWIYSLFDTIQLLNKKDRGEKLEDISIIEDIEKHRISGEKSKVITTVLAMFPGAGHLYLGLQQRGIQLMIFFLLSIYLLDVLHLSIFLFLIPVIWFFSFFDALQQFSRYEWGEINDVPVIKYFLNHQKWLGIGLIVVGFFIILDSILVPGLARELQNWNIYYYYQEYFQTGVVSLVLVVIGFKLLMGKKVEKGDEES